MMQNCLWHNTNSAKLQIPLLRILFNSAYPPHHLNLSGEIIKLLLSKQTFQTTGNGVNTIIDAQLCRYFLYFNKEVSLN